MAILIASFIFIWSISSVLACEPTLTTVIGTEAPQSFCSGDLIFEDNFNTLDRVKWYHEQSMWGGGNYEFQWYVNDLFNSFVSPAGHLHFRPTLTSDIFGEDFLTSGHVKIPPEICSIAENYGCERWGTPDNIINPIRSALITSFNSFSFKFGTLEVRAKMPAGDWLWPAIWMMPRESAYGPWPISGEIDLAELRGNRDLHDTNGTHVGNEQIGSTMHFGPRYDINGFMSAHGTKNRSPGFDEDFHVYKVVWTPNSLQYFVDNEIITTVNAEDGFWKRGNFESSGLPNPWTQGTIMAPFDKEFYIIINLAVGGTGYFHDDFINKPNPKPWKNNSPRAAADFWEHRNEWLPTWNLGGSDTADLQIDYVRVYAL